MLQQNYRQRMSWEKSSRTLAQRAQDPALNLQAHHALWTTSFILGNFVQTRKHAEQGLIIYDPQQHRSHAFIYGGHDPGCAAGSLTLCPCGYSAFRSSPLDRIKEAVNLAQDLSHPLSLASAITHAALLHLWRREAASAQERAEAVIALSSEQGFARFEMGQDHCWAGRWPRSGKEDEGMAHVRQGMSRLSVRGRNPNTSRFILAFLPKYTAALEKPMRA